MSGSGSIDSHRFGGLSFCKFRVFYSLILVKAIKMSDYLMKRTPLPDGIQIPESDITDSLTTEEEAFRRVCGNTVGVERE